MHTIKHALISLPISAALYFVYGENVIYFFLASFIVDIDHIFMIPFKLKYLNIVKQHKAMMYYSYHREFSAIKKTLFPLHTIEFLFILAAMSFYHEIFILILMGVVVHLLLDMFYEIYRFRQLIKAQNMSALLWFLKRI